MSTTGIVNLYNVEGIARLSGYDSNGNAWTQYTLDPFCSDPGDDGEVYGADYGDECGNCGVEMFSGWLCLDGGDTVCSECVDIKHRKGE